MRKGEIGREGEKDGWINRWRERGKDDGREGWMGVRRERRLESEKAGGRERREKGKGGMEEKEGGREEGMLEGSEREGKRIKIEILTLVESKKKN